MIKTYKFKLYNSKRNKKLHRQIIAAGLTYNHCIALHKRYYRLFHKYLNKYKLQKHLAKISKLPNFSYLREYGSQAVQNVTERIHFGYQKFFDKQNKRPPKFRKLHKCKSLTLKQAGWKLDEETHTIVINKQKYRYHKSREIEGIVKTVTIKRDRVGDIYIFLSCEVEQNTVIPRLGKSIGFDFGLKGHILVAPTEEDDVDMPSFFKRARRRIKKGQQGLSRKLNANVDHYAKGKKGGNIPVWKRPIRECKNIQKGFKEVARLHRKVKNQKEGFHWHLAQELCGKYALICIESLNMRWMSKSHGRKVGDYGFSDFVRILQYVAAKYGTTIVKVDKLFPSSQLCHDCGFKNKAVKNVLIREWYCPECGAYHDRDRNAAKNILREGLRIFEAS
jgi:putative transposase